MHNPLTRPMVETELEGWAVQRARGRNRFIWSMGALRFGTVTAVLMILWFLVFTDLPQWPPLIVAGFLAVIAALNILGGAVWGWGVWWWMERHYENDASEQRRCSQCGYRMDGIGRRCPECGHEGEDQKK